MARSEALQCAVCVLENANTSGTLKDATECGVALLQASSTGVAVGNQSVNKSFWRGEICRVARIARAIPALDPPTYPEREREACRRSLHEVN